MKAWPDTAFPLRVVIDRSELQFGFQQDWTPQDSANLWRWLDELNTEAGRPLFRAAQHSDLTSFVLQPLHPEFGKGTPSVAVGAVQVEISRALQGAAGGGQPMWGPDWSFVGARAQFQAGDALKNRHLVKHEFIHTLGIIHACGFQSLMSYCRQTSEVLTPHDIAYLELLLRTTTLMRTEGVRFTLWETAAGEIEARAVN